MKKENLRKELFIHIKSLNKAYNDINLLEMEVRRLLSLCHPLYRLDYAKKLEKLDMLDEDSLQRIEQKARMIMQEKDFNFGLYLSL